MAKSVLQQGIAAVSDTLLALLKGKGFRRKAPHLYRPSGQLVHVVHLQGSVWGDANEGEFTVNVGISHPTLAEAWLGSPRNPVTARFPIDVRLGRLTPENRDLWWNVAIGQDLSAVITDVAAKVTAHALSLFERLPDEAALLRALRAGGEGLPLYMGYDSIRGLLAIREGSMEEAREALGKALGRGGEGFEQTVRTAAARLGLELD